MKKNLVYPFLYDESKDLRCDFEILTDEISSMIGLLTTLVNDNHLKNNLSKMNEIMYHINPSIRTKTTVTKEELEWLEEKFSIIQNEVRYRFNKFVLALKFNKDSNVDEVEFVSRNYK